MPTDWQKSLITAVRDAGELLSLLEINDIKIVKPIIDKKFPLFVSRSFIDRMEKNNPQDPLLLQILPTENEIIIVPGYTQDPLKEVQVNPVDGLLHKYHGRVLLLLSAGCAVNCRYCFRRHFPYDEVIPKYEDWKKAVDYIANDASITEVIFSGGDPLLVKDQYLSSLVKKLEVIPHLKRLRLHTRFPVLIPERINETFLNWFSGSRLQSVMVVHINHANEINHDVAEMFQRCRGAGITLLNQTVLLKGVNDSAESLVNLSERLFDVGVSPYYLNMLDKVQGAAHFDVSEAQAKLLMLEMRKKLPGYLVPKLVREIPGVGYKVPIL